ncbi:MAG: lipid-A-disaccharide synthase [Tannerella sp.]|jgi:lipid-A-disaccharide synthase|nr:lipid-A-disaccharide synthase [Tannerella sp.]
MRYYLVAGEASGDLHASNLMKELKTQDPTADFRFFGGDLMQAVGGTLVKHYREMAFMGVIPVLLHARTIINNMQLCREDIRAFRPDLVILIDYPGFNLKIAEFVKTRLQIPVYYYISPKIWAWKKYRIKAFRRYVDRMFCILPFEVDFYNSLNYSVDYVGNPSVDSMAAYCESKHLSPETVMSGNSKPVLAVLAGSRKAEIAQNLPLMLEVAACFPHYSTIIAGAPGLTPEDYKKYSAHYPDATIVFDQTYNILDHAEAALVTSGTATLETALFRVPQVVCYHVAGGWLVNFVFKRFFHVPYISLVNLIAGREVVKELFGAKFAKNEVFNELRNIVADDAYRGKMLAGYDEIIAKLGKPGASRRTAELIIKYMEK